MSSTASCAVGCGGCTHARASGFRILLLGPLFRRVPASADFASWKGRFDRAPFLQGASGRSANYQGHFAALAHFPTLVATPSMCVRLTGDAKAVVRRSSEAAFDSVVVETLGRQPDLTCRARRSQVRHRQRHHAGGSLHPFFKAMSGRVDQGGGTQAAPANLPRRWPTRGKVQDHHLRAQRTRFLAAWA